MTLREQGRGGEFRLLVTDEQILSVLKADPVVLFSAPVLDRLCRRRASLGDGIMTVRTEDGDVTYGLSDYDLETDTWVGIRSGV